MFSISRRSDAAAYINQRYGFPCSPGPVFRKGGRYLVYEPSLLDRWARDHRSDLTPDMQREPES